MNVLPWLDCETLVLYKFYDLSSYSTKGSPLTLLSYLHGKDYWSCKVYIIYTKLSIYSIYDFKIIRRYKSISVFYYYGCSRIIPMNIIGLYVFFLISIHLQIILHSFLAVGRLEWNNWKVDGSMLMNFSQSMRQFIQPIYIFLSEFVIIMVILLPSGRS